MTSFCKTGCEMTSTVKLRADQIINRLEPAIAQTEAVLHYWSTQCKEEPDNADHTWGFWRTMSDSAELDDISDLISHGIREFNVSVSVASILVRFPEEEVY